jgi:hypothetical protein
LGCGTFDHVYHVLLPNSRLMVLGTLLYLASVASPLADHAAALVQFAGADLLLKDGAVSGTLLWAQPVDVSGTEGYVPHPNQPEP